MDVTPLSVNIERVEMIEDLRTFKDKLLVFIRWTTPSGVLSEGLAIWGVHDDGSVDCGEWLRTIEVRNARDHGQADGWL